MTRQSATSDKATVKGYVVSLARQRDRREEMSLQLARSGVTAEFFDAVDAQSGSCRARLDGLPSQGPWGGFKDTDKACTLSHLDVLSAFLRSDHDFCLVLEDDAQVSLDLSLWLRDLGWWPDDADVVKLERWPDDRLYLLMSRSGPMHLNRTICRLKSRHSGTAGYVISRKAARQVVTAPAPSVPIDHLLFNSGVSRVAQSLSVYQISPALVRQPEKQHLPVRLNGNRPARPLTRELRRGFYQLSEVPGQLARLASGRYRLGRISWADTTVGPQMRNPPEAAFDTAAAS